MLQATNISAAALALLLLGSCAAAKRANVLQGENQALHAKVNQLQQTNDQLQQTNSQLQQEVSTLKTNIQSGLDAFAQYKRECEETQARLQVAQAVLRDQYTALQEVATKIDEAMSDWADKGVDVYYKNGFVYVSMEDKLLYKSGSSALGTEGKKALASLAGVLDDYPKLRIVIVGNTDDAQFKKGNMDNWSLSTERANGVVRTFRDAYKIDPARLTAAGRSKYNPIADNSTAAGKAKNRRTDIILNPDLDKLWESVDQ